MSALSNGLPIAGLEAVFDHLALTIDQVSADKRELFLVKLALLNANAIGDAERFQQNVNTALLNL